MASAQLHRSVELNPTHETRHDVDVYWQIPQHPKAILFIAHGGGGRPSTYWDVEGSTGLPEHKAIVKNALERGFAVIAIKSVDHGWSHWPTESSADIANVEKILSEWKGEHPELKDLHLTVLGSSSGGNFISALAHKLPVYASVLIVSHGVTEAIDAASKGSYPPTLFVHMPKDDFTASKVKQEIKTLESKGIPAAEVVADPLPVTPTFFSDGIEGLDADLSRKLHELLLSNNVINAEGFVEKKLDPPELHRLLTSSNLLPEDDESPRPRGGRFGPGHGPRDQTAEGEEGEVRRSGPRHGHRGPQAQGEEGETEVEGRRLGRGPRGPPVEGEEVEGEGRKFGRGPRGPPVEGEEVEGEGRRFGRGPRGPPVEGEEVEGEGRRHGRGPRGPPPAEGEEVEGEGRRFGRGPRGPAAEGEEVDGEGRRFGPGRGHRGPRPVEGEEGEAGVGHGAGPRHHPHHRGPHHGGPHGHFGPRLKWERQIKDQLQVAEGHHALTSRKNAEVFDWLDGKSWNSRASA